MKTAGKEKRAEAYTDWSSVGLILCFFVLLCICLYCLKMCTTDKLQGKKCYSAHDILDGVGVPEEGNHV